MCMNVCRKRFDFVAIVLKEQAAAKKDEERMLWSSISQVQIYPIPTVPTMGHETRVLTQDLYWPTLLTLFSSLSSCQTINWWKAYSVSGQQVSSAVNARC